MYHKIGKVVTVTNGRKTIVEENKTHACDGCIFEFQGVWQCCHWLRFIGIIGQCGKEERRDHKDIIYREIKEEIEV